MTTKGETSILVNIVDYKILLYAPNIIGYIRIALLVAAFYNFSSSILFLFLYSSSIILDAVDGSVARKFNQTSSFGAWLDVIIDNIGRGLLWVQLHPLFYIISVVEWSAFVCNYQLGPQWQEYLTVHKHSTQRVIETPRFISRIIANNFRNFWGAWAIAGLHVLPVWMYGMQENTFNTHLAFLPNYTDVTGFALLFVGRLICMAAEIGTICLHIKLLLTRNSA